MSQQIGAFSCIPFTEKGRFPSRLMDWCTVCDAPSKVQNKHTGEVTNIFMFDDSSTLPQRVVVLENGQRWVESEFRQHWEPVCCH